MFRAGCDIKYFRHRIPEVSKWELIIPPCIAFLFSAMPTKGGGMISISCGDCPEEFILHNTVCITLGVIGVLLLATVVFDLLYFICTMCMLEDA